MSKKSKHAVIVFSNMTGKKNHALQCNVEAVDTIVGWYMEVHSGDHVRFAISYPKRRDEREMNPPRNMRPDP